MTLPSGAYLGAMQSGGGSIDSSMRSFIAVKNPVGFAEPCVRGGGAQKPVAHTIAAFSAYLDSLPGFTVQSASLQVGGKPAVHLTIPSSQTSDCPSGRVEEWSYAQSTGSWHLNQGDTDVVYLVQVGSDLYLFQWLADSVPAVTPEEEVSLLSTMSFLTALPTP